MTVGMQGAWTVSFKSKEAAWPQRFRIKGSSNGADGTYDENSPPIFVAGSQWCITVEYNSPGPSGRMASRHKIANFRTSNDQFLFDIHTDDSAGDEDFNDFVLTCSTVLTSWDYIIYGTVRTYSGYCPINPCFPRPYLVVDSAMHFSELLTDATALELLKKLYPLRVKPLLARPMPQPDPGPFRPLMIPTGLPDDPGILVKQNVDAVVATEMKADSTKDKAAITDQRTSLTLASGAASQSALMKEDEKLTAARLRGRFSVKRCQIKNASQLILRFLEYDRTDAEKLGDPYTGDGSRQVLGITASDELGNYIFRFTQTKDMVLEEMGDIGIGEDAASQISPDIIVQILESLPEGVSYETAPYYNLHNIRRINLCLPSDVIHPPRKACQGGRAIQDLGNISMLIEGNLNDDGTVSNTSSTAPLVDHAAWCGWVDLFACFLDTTPSVKCYTIRYRREELHDDEIAWSSWNWVNQYYPHKKQQLDGTWLEEKVGPDTRSLRVNGLAHPKAAVPSYLNIENQITNHEWQNAGRDRKLQIDTSIYQPESGKVEFLIEGYDDSGERVPDADDRITLYIDNNFSKGDIAFAKPVGATGPTDCAIFDIESADMPFAVKFRVIDKEGFLKSYKLEVYRGPNFPVDTKDESTGLPILESYGSLNPGRFNIYSDRLFGTKDMLAADLNGYVEISVVPASGSWLPADREACCFSFELSSLDRVTTGYTVPGWRMLWRELVGISHKSKP